jgi:release factor glutamine methyltransferase
MKSARVVPGLKAGVTVAEAQRMMANTFRLSGIDSPETDARALLAATLRLTRAQLIAQADRILETREASAASAIAGRRIRREPVSRILGRKEFWSLPLTVTPDVLVPRPETETLVEAALEEIDRAGTRAETLRLLDIGTGSGAIALALLQELPHASAVATDRSRAAVLVARANAERLGLSSRCAFVVCDIADGLAARFDLIVSNPPYIARAGIAALDPEVRDYDPQLALDGGADGLDAYRAIVAVAPKLMARGARLILELGIGQADPVASLATKAGLVVTSIKPDLSGIPRALVAKSP